jgi:antitoxin CptB
MDDPHAVRRKRLRFRAWHRGTREADLVMGGFADANIADMSDVELDRFEELLEMHDADVVDWVLGTTTVPPELDNPLVQRLLRHEVRY